MSRRYFVENIAGESATITGEDAYQLKEVLRVKVGEEIIICDGRGFDYQCSIQKVESSEILLLVKSKSQSLCEPNINLTVFMAASKGNKVEVALEKAVELGAKAFCCFESRNCTAKIKDADKQTLRLEKLAKAAAKQCARGEIPKIIPALSLKELANSFSSYDLVLICYEEGGFSLEQVISTSKFKNIAVLIGSEGGFAKDEIDKAKAAGAVVIGLGPRILRCETAAITATALIMAYSGNLN